jgi:hypothetical protein
MSQSLSDRVAKCAQVTLQQMQCCGLQVCCIALLVVIVTLSLWVVTVTDVVWIRLRE